MTKVDFPAPAIPIVIITIGFFFCSSVAIAVQDKMRVLQSNFCSNRPHERPPSKTGRWASTDLTRRASGPIPSTSLVPHRKQRWLRLLRPLQEALEVSAQTHGLLLPQEVEDADRRISTGLPQVARTTKDGSAVGSEEGVVDAEGDAEI